MTTHNIPFSIQKKNTLNYSKSVQPRDFLGTRERVQNSRDERAISVRDTEVLLYMINVLFKQDLRYTKTIYIMSFAPFITRVNKE